MEYVFIVFAVIVIGVNGYAFLRGRRLTQQLHLIHWELDQLREKLRGEEERSYHEVLRFVLDNNRTHPDKQIPVVTYLPSGGQVPALNNRNLLQLALEHGIDLATSCGGAGACGMCAIEVHSGAEHLTPMNAVEESFLGSGGNGRQRLACQCRTTGHVKIEGIN